MFSLAVDEHWLATNPLYRFRKLSERDSKRKRILENGERPRFLAECQKSKSPFLYPAVILGLYMGMRISEILTLKWSQVDLERKVGSLPLTKTDTPRVIEMNSVVFDMLAFTERKGKYVFQNGEKHIDNIKKAFTNAKKRAGIINFHFHDLRHCWASDHQKAGTPLHVIRDL